MLVIRRAQVEAFEREQMERTAKFIARRVQALVQKMRIDDVGDVPAFVAAGLEAARNRGFEMEDDAVLFVECQAMFGANFERDPTGRIGEVFSRLGASAREKAEEARGILCFEMTDFWRDEP